MQRTREQQAAHEWLTRCSYAGRHAEAMEDSRRLQVEQYSRWCPGRPWIKPMQSLIAMYDGEIEQARAEYRAFVEVIEAVEDDMLRELLTLYHIDGLSWEQVADRMWYSTKHIFNIYRKALTEVYKILSDRGSLPVGELDAQ